MKISWSLFFKSVRTSSRLLVWPNKPGILPDWAQVTVDFRHPDREATLAMESTMHEAMERAAERIVAGEPVAQALADAKAEVVAAGFNDVEYLELRAVGTLKSLDALTDPARLLAAANLAGVRLIDNIAVDPKA